MLGPNHPDYGKPQDQGPMPKWRRPHVPPRPVDSNGDARIFTLAEIVKAYAAEHDRLSGGPCPCVLCADLRVHIEADRARRNGGAR